MPCKKKKSSQTFELLFYIQILGIYDGFEVDSFKSLKVRNLYKKNWYNLKDFIGYKIMVGTENFENFLFYMKFDALNNEFWVEDDLKQFNRFNLRRF